ncbi:hypothetical protein [Clostridium sp. YIM B02551]|uniref:hypothetical protein n=1 Tax=Clostridium sp. YIM B02551 TaxID=2910679 RepID=UPI001EEB22B9|nr:hypothetical protein [Clostridium sp. YIM B02551]
MLLNVIELINKSPYGELKNTLKEPVFDVSKIPGADQMQSFFDTMDSFNKNIGKVINFIGKIGYSIAHPAVIFHYIFSIFGVICIIIVCGGIIAYAMGYKKAGLWVQGSIAGYVIIRMLGMVI